MEKRYSVGDYGMKLHWILTHVIHWNSASTYATQHLSYPLQNFRFKEYVINVSNHLSTSDCEYFIYRRS